MATLTELAVKKRYTLREYLDFEGQADERHEFHNGEIMAMSGGSYRHARIAGNLFLAIGSRLKGKPCHPLNSDMRVRIPKKLRYLYPDISILCGPPEFDAEDVRGHTILNPKIVIEILSDSSEQYDRTEKFELYGQNPFVREYVLISQNAPGVETFRRQPGGAWLFQPRHGLKERLELHAVKLSIPLREIYDGVAFRKSAAKPGQARRAKKQT